MKHVTKQDMLLRARDFMLRYTNIEKSVAYNPTSVSTLIGQVPVQEID